MWVFSHPITSTSHLSWNWAPRHPYSSELCLKRRKYNLSAALSHVVHLCAKHSFESLTRADEQVPISNEMLSQICIESWWRLYPKTKWKRVCIRFGFFFTIMYTKVVNYGSSIPKDIFPSYSFLNGYNIHVKLLV